MFSRRPGSSRMKSTASAKLSKSDYELLAEFRYALRVYLAFSEQSARSHGLTPQQYQALLAIEGFRGRNRVTIGELAEQLQIAHHSAVGLVDRLETIHLVQRKGSTEDRRKVVVTLTRPGRTILEKLYRVHRAELRAAGPQLAALLAQAADQVQQGASRTS